MQAHTTLPTESPLAKERFRTKYSGGYVYGYTHASETCACDMDFSLFVPPQAEAGAVPCLMYLSGLTCTDENFIIKSGAQRFAAEAGIALLVPDTGPRNTGIPGEDDDDYLGSGASYYLDATQEPWAKHYNMFSYVNDELPKLAAKLHNVDTTDRFSVFGHSMGGHGALISAFKRPEQYRSVSAFAPVSAPSHTEPGKRMFRHYLGDDETARKAYDASELVRDTAWNKPILVDMGGDDALLHEGRLRPELLVQAAEAAGKDIRYTVHEGYEHSYPFVSSFIDKHIAYHAGYLNG